MGRVWSSVWLFIANAALRQGSWPTNHTATFHVKICVYEKACLLVTIELTDRSYLGEVYPRTKAVYVTPHHKMRLRLHRRILIKTP